MKTLNLIILFSLIGKVVYSQNNITYHYVLNEPIVKTDSGVLFGKKIVFSTKRKFINSKLFSEKGLFTGDDTKSILYKIEKGIWYYKVKNKWKLFYDFKTKKGGYISLLKEIHKIQFIKTVTIRNEIFHKIDIKPVRIFRTHNPDYYFSPSKGIIIIRASNGIILVRRENFDTPLTYAELDSL